MIYFTVKDNDGVEVARARCSVCPRNVLWIYYLIVETQYRKNGYGTKLLEKILDYADKHNLDTALIPAAISSELNAMNSARLRHWYKQHGFLDARGFPFIQGDMVRKCRVDVALKSRNTRKPQKSC